MTAPRKTPPSTNRAMCCVRIGYQEYLLPAEKGMRVLELMQHAVECDHSYEHGTHQEYYQVKASPRLELVVVKATSIRMPADAKQPGESRPLMLERSR